MGDAVTKKTIVLGAEHDPKLREVVLNTLRELGGYPKHHDWGVGGSQELETLEVDLGGKVVTVESETYIGLSITGDSELVDKIAVRVQQRLSGPPSA